MNHNYSIVVDSTIDLPPDMADECGLTVIPYRYTLDGQDYLDNRELSIQDFYNALRNGKTGSTTLITAYHYVKTWEPILKQGKDILHLCLSSAVSKSYEQSLLAVQEMKEKYPERTVIAIDSKGGSLGEGLLAYYTARYRDDGKSLIETEAYIEKLITRLHHWIMVDDLQHLRRGGRLSGSSAFIGSLIGIKPVLTILDDGRLMPIKKIKGRNKALEYFMERMEEQNMNPNGQLIAIAHSDMPEAAQQLKEMVVSKYGEVPFLIHEIGPIIGVHVGPGAIALMFLGEQRITSST